MSVYEILQELESNNSSNFKLEVLKREENNELLKQFFVATLDPSINYYIKKIPTYNSKMQTTMDLAEAMEQIKKLSKRIISGNKAKIHISKIMSSLNESDRNAFERIVKRDAGCGVSYTTVNKVWPNLISIWPCNLCERSNEKNFANIVYPAIVQEKADGMRFNPCCHNGEYDYRSRNGKYVQLHGMLDHEIEQFKKDWGSDNIVIDCEALVVDNLGNILERTKGNGIMNKAIQNTISEIDAAHVVIRVWNVIPEKEFFSGLGTEKYINTLKKIRDILKNGNYKKIKLIKTQIVQNEKEAFDFYADMLSKGKEGAIIKNMDCVFEDKRSKYQVKLKLKESVDMVCTGTYPHEKKPEWIGGLTLESSDGIVKVNCGSGLEDEDRKQKPSFFVDKVIRVETNGLLKNKKTNQQSLFLPIYKEVRTDKDTADTYEDIVAIFEEAIKRR